MKFSLESGFSESSACRQYFQVCSQVFFVCAF